MRFAVQVYLPIMNKFLRKLYIAFGQKPDERNVPTTLVTHKPAATRVKVAFLCVRAIRVSKHLCANVFRLAAQMSLQLSRSRARVPLCCFCAPDFAALAPPAASRPPPLDDKICAQKNTSHTSTGRDTAKHFAQTETSSRAHRVSIVSIANCDERRDIRGFHDKRSCTHKGRRCVAATKNAVEQNRPREFYALLCAPVEVFAHDPIRLIQQGMCRQPAR